MTDPIADMLTRIRNAIRARHETVKVPRSKMKVWIAEVLRKEGFIEGYELLDEGPGGTILIRLKYGPSGEPAITDLQRVSKPGRRVYVDRKHIPWVKNGLGIAVLSTSRGILTDREARRRGVGGEVLFYVW